MEFHEAIIFNVDFVPYAEPAFSTIEIYAIIPNENSIAYVRDSNVIPELSKKYEFEVSNGNNCDLTSMHKRDCLLDLVNREYTFVRYI